MVVAHVIQKMFESALWKPWRGIGDSWKQKRSALNNYDPISIH